jgi:hypothetical protein
LLRPDFRSAQPPAKTPSRKAMVLLILEPVLRPRKSLQNDEPPD